jgi:glucose-1-phosphate thymidylyltransferase
VLIGPTESVAVGLPDTIWFPHDALARLPQDQLAFLLFPVQRPELFDAVETDDAGRVLQVQVKSVAPRSSWVWGAFRMPGEIFHELYDFWHARGEHESYVGTLINAWLAEGGRAVGVRAGERYVDVGTLHGYREAMGLLARANPVSRNIPLQGA